MAKGWTTIYTNKETSKRTISERNRMERKADNMIRNTESLSLDAMQRINDYNYEIQQLSDDRLLEAFAEHKLKSKIAIKRAMKVKRDREKASEKKEN